MADEPVDENAENADNAVNEEGAEAASPAAAETPEVAGSEGADDAGDEAPAEADAEAGVEMDADADEPTLAADEPAPGDGAVEPAAEAHRAGPAMSPVRPQRPPMHAVAVSFAPVAEAGAKSETSLDFLFDIPVQVTVRLGETRILIRDLLQLGQGSVVELDKLAGEPLEVVVNNKLMARGEVVVVNEKFGIRLTDVVTPAERIHSLK
jgi:flagellar motor switch protein FliN/FliY